MSSKYEPIMVAVNTAVTELENLPAEERAGWLAYLFEALEEAEGEQALETARDLLQQRLERGGW